MNNKIKILFLLVLGLVILPQPAFAQSSSVSLSSMFANFSSSAEALITLVKYSAYVIGIFLVVGSIFKFSQLGQGQMTAKTPLTMFFCGIGIFALTSTVSIATQTMAMGDGPGTILMPSSGGFGATTAQALYGVLVFVRLVGYIAFIRGWLLLNQYGQGKDGTLGRGLTHIFGGVAAINITVTAKILANTFAPGLPLPF